jgi:hypothetical protein
MPGFLHVVAAAAALHSVDVPKTFGHKVHKAKADSGLAVELPNAFNTTYNTLYPEVSARKGFWELDLSLAKPCNGANVCGFASFLGADHGKLFGKPVQLDGGITGKYAKSMCGANCSPPTIAWRQNGVRYEFSLKDIRGNAKQAMTTLANQAINAGPR